MIFFWILRFVGWIIDCFRGPPPNYNHALLWSQPLVDIHFDNIAMRNCDLDEVE